LKKAVFAALVGRTNAGKSSLLNLLVGDKVAIVSNKPQTTRTQIHGLITLENGDCASSAVSGTQYVFTDTPGLHDRHSRLSDHMLKSARSALADGDVIIMLADLSKAVSNGKVAVSKTERNLIASFPANIPVILVLNKADLMSNKNDMLLAIKAFSEIYDFAEIIPVSVLKEENTKSILPMLDKYAAECEEYPFNPEIATDQSEKFFLAELLREKLLRSMSDEIPHGIAVEIETLNDTKTNKGEPIVDIQFLVICEKASHKGMIIGKQGENLKRMGEKTRAELEEYFESKVNMKIWVKVVDNWRNKESFIVQLGLSSED
jgi:GTP-binding protein Era